MTRLLRARQLGDQTVTEGDITATQLYTAPEASVRSRFGDVGPFLGHALGSDGLLYVCCGPHVVKLSKGQAERIAMTPPQNGGRVTSIRAVPNGHAGVLVSTLGDRTVPGKLMYSENEQARFSVSRGSVHDFCVAGGGSVALLSESKSLQIVSLDTWQLVSMLRTKRPPVLVSALPSVGEQVCVGGFRDASVALYDLRTTQGKPTLHLGPSIALMGSSVLLPLDEHTVLACSQCPTGVAGERSLKQQYRASTCSARVFDTRMAGVPLFGVSKAPPSVSFASVCGSLMLFGERESRYVDVLLDRETLVRRYEESAFACLAPTSAGAVSLTRRSGGEWIFS